MAELFIWWLLEDIGAYKKKWRKIRAQYAWITIASLSAVPGMTKEKNYQRVEGILDKACIEQPDVVVLPEIVGLLGVGLRKEKNYKNVAESDSGPLCQIAAGYAKKYNTYIILPLFETDKDKVYNSAILFDRKGNICGKYRKIHPTINEIKKGITPGKEYSVFETDFGKIGIPICFDIYFPDVAKTIAKKGAKIIFYCAVFEAGLKMLQPMAFLNRVFVASSTPGKYSYIINPLGEVVHQKSHYYEVATAKINLDYEVFCTDYMFEKIPHIKRKYGRGIEIKILGAEGVFLMGSSREDVTTKDIQREFKMETLDEYLLRSLTYLDKGK